MRRLLLALVIMLFGAMFSACTPPPPRHVIWIIEENESYSDITTSSQAPYINKTLIPHSQVWKTWHNLSHYSLDNYIGMMTDESVAKLQPYTGDCNPSPGCLDSSNNLLHKMDVDGLSWRIWAESMPSNCDKSNSGEYAVRHNPGPYLTDLTTCKTNDVPAGANASKLVTTMASDSTTPAFSEVVPNVCNDMHDCSIATGDAWLKATVTAIQNTAVYKQGATSILLTWDEGSSGAQGENCANNNSDPESCNVLSLWTGYGAAVGKKNTTVENHYELTAITEYLLGVS